MTEINPNLIYQKQNMSYGAATPDIRQTINDNTVIKTQNDSKDKIRKAVLIPVLGAGIYYGMAHFNKACQGEYGETVLAKSGKFGDKVAKWKIFDNNFVNTIVEASEKYYNKFFENVVPKSKVLNAFFKKRSKPQAPMAAIQTGGSLAEVTKNAADELWKYTNEGKDIYKIKGCSAKDLKDIQKTPEDSRMTDKLMGILKENRNLIINSGEKKGKIPFTKRFTHDKQPRYLTQYIKGKWLKTVLGSDRPLSEHLNKLKALKGMGSGELGTTRLGKALPKFLYKAIEGITQSSSGGLFAAVLGGWFLSDAVINTIKAKGFNEKRKTLPENLIYLASWYTTMPLCMKAMHGVGGLQYIGTKDVEAYRKEWTKFLAKTSGVRVEGNKFIKLTQAELDKFGGLFQSKDEYNKALKELKTMLKGDAKWYHKPLIWIGRMMTTGLEQIRPYEGKDANPVIKRLKQGKYWVKQGIGYPERILMFLFVLSPFFAKMGAKMSHIFFGKPKVSVLDEDKEDKKAEEEKQKSQQFIGQPNSGVQQGAAPGTVAPELAQTVQVPTASQVPAAAQAQNVQAPVQQPQQPQQQAATPVAGQPVAAKRSYSYIPSSAPVQVSKDKSSQKNQDDAKLNNAINKFDKAAKVAEQYTK